MPTCTSDVLPLGQLHFGRTFLASGAKECSEPPISAKLYFHPGRGLAYRYLALWLVTLLPWFRKGTSLMSRWNHNDV
eukprot:2167130-Amphidinium_carterae.1